MNDATPRKKSLLRESYPFSPELEEVIELTCAYAAAHNLSPDQLTDEDFRVIGIPPLRFKTEDLVEPSQECLARGLLKYLPGLGIQEACRVADELLKATDWEHPNVWYRKPGSFAASKYLLGSVAVSECDEF